MKSLVIWPDLSSQTIYSQDQMDVLVVETPNIISALFLSLHRSWVYWLSSGLPKWAWLPKVWQFFYIVATSWEHCQMTSGIGTRAITRAVIHYTFASDQAYYIAQF